MAEAFLLGIDILVMALILFWIVLNPGINHGAKNTGWFAMRGYDMPDESAPPQDNGKSFRSEPTALRNKKMQPPGVKEQNRTRMRHGVAIDQRAPYQ